MFGDLRFCFYWNVSICDNDDLSQIQNIALIIQLVHKLSEN